MNVITGSCVVSLALTLLALTGSGGFAASDSRDTKTYNASHSNTANEVAPGTSTGGSVSAGQVSDRIISNPAAEKSCIASGGKVLTGQGGEKLCSINYNASKSNTGNIR